MDAPRPRLAAVQLVSAVVDGVALSSVVVHATLHLGVAPASIGLVLAAAAAVALASAVPVGALADRAGLRAAAALGGVLTALALLGYAAAGSLPVFAVAAALFMTAQAAAGAARQGLAVEGVPAARRLAVRAQMHTLLNAGLGGGTALGAVLVAVAPDAGYRATYVVAAVASLVASAVVLGLRRADGTTVPAVARRPTGALVALRDGRFAAAAALATVVQLTMPILSVLLPVWVLRHTVAPAWTAAAALGVNTVLVIAVQRRWAARVVDDRAAARSALVAAASLVAAGLLLAATGGLATPAAAAATAVVAVVVLTAGEVAGGAATWRVALSDVPSAAEGRYQSAFAMSTSAARVLGPLAALPLVLAAPAAGWVGLTSVMAAACLAVAAMATARSVPSRYCSAGETYR